MRLYSLDAGATAAVFGVGLIGSAICRHLERHGHIGREVAWPWVLSGPMRGDFADVLEGIRDQAAGPVKKLAVIWSAGRGGFNLSQKDEESELTAHGQVLGLLSAARTAWPTASIELHQISSAGGLFEGLTAVDRGTRPRPVRRYGRLKLEQEERARKHPAASSVMLYRPSTVFSAPRAGHRRGIVSALIEHVLSEQVTPLFGRPDTLRDYIWVEDVGRIVADYVRESPADEGRTSVRFLVSALPTSLATLVAMVGRAMGRKPYYHYVESVNAQDITFMPSLLVSGISVTPLQEAVVKSCMQARYGRI